MTQEYSPVALELRVEIAWQMALVTIQSRGASRSDHYSSRAPFETLSMEADNDDRKP